MNNKGFTLAEVAVTLSILALMATIAIPSYISWLPKHRLMTSVRQIYDDLNLAKMTAVRTNTIAVVTFYPANNNYTIFLDRSDPLNYSFDTATDISIRGLAGLEKGVNLYETTGLAGNTLAFNNRGMIYTGPGQVHLNNPNGLYLGVDLNIAGSISIITSKDNGATWIPD